MYSVLHMDLVFLVMVLGHILGDFYFQSSHIAKKKETKYAAVCLHSLFYALTIAGTVLLCIPQGANRIYLIFSVSFFHFLIDSIKFPIDLNRNQRGTTEKFQRILSIIEDNLLLIDQAVHFATLALCWYLFGRALDVHWLLSTPVSHLPHLPLTMLLGFLCVLKPVGIWIGKSKLSPAGPRPADPGNSAGKIIGYLERVIVLMFLMRGQYSAIVFVLTAKSVARYKEIESNRGFAEYYLIGTLMSVGSAMAIALLLGLTK